VVTVIIVLKVTIIRTHTRGDRVHNRDHHITMPCIKYTVTNGCGHVGLPMYRYCEGNHKNDARSSAICFESSVMADGTIQIVSMGTGFCNRGCEAMIVGWECCTCGYDTVVGFYDSRLGMLVHEDRKGEIHGFCDSCFTRLERQSSASSDRGASIGRSTRAAQPRGDCHHGDGHKHIYDDLRTMMDAMYDKVMSPEYAVPHPPGDDGVRRERHRRDEGGTRRRTPSHGRDFDDVYDWVRHDRQ